MTILRMAYVVVEAFAKKLRVTTRWLLLWRRKETEPIPEKTFIKRYEYDFQPVNLTFGFHRKPDLVLGPCDGIFCLVWSIRDHALYEEKEVPTIALWNPATRAFSILPADHFFPDVLIDDGRQISTYNKSDGVFHWFALHNNNSCSVSCYEGLVLSFDMSKELFHVTLLPEKFNTFTENITLPPNVDYTKRKDCSLGLIKDSLAVIFSFLEEGHTSIEVWVMKKDFNCVVEVEKSSYRWFHELTVEVPIPGSWAPLGFWNKNELLIRKWRCELDTLILYDIVTKQARNVKISGERNFMYKESLVSVKGGCGN
ncbi:hypothetical protein RHGRI_024843 [Rhododendron griersonianum]|uniref:F-box associated domain-containing protein n=1 Tax=Rhododendron griersonianum TaxID=479676 RepID=A0AAV6JAZ9_9ERIC|nr:hypothetical protein RHGRI_024843 [Rhododendron griersonianum]